MSHFLSGHGFDFVAWWKRAERRLARRRRPYRVESLEARLALDGTVNSSEPTFEPTPGGGGGPFVSQATLQANNDTLYEVYVGEMTSAHVLANDVLPANDPARVSRIAEVPAEVEILIADEGQRLVITPSSAATGKYEVIYDVTTASGKQGSAVVTLYVHRRPDGPEGDWLRVLEDTTDNRLDVLANDRSFAEGEIVAVAGGNAGSSIAISPDGKAVDYTPAPGIRSDGFEYQVRRADGGVESASVYVSVRPRYEIYGDDLEVDRDSAAVVRDLLWNDRADQPAETPRIVQVGSSAFGSRIELNPDGRSITYEAAAGLVANETISYTVRYGPEAHHVARGSLSIHVIEPLLAVDDWFFVAPDASQQTLPVLANDLSRATWGNVAGGGRTLAVVGASQGTAGGQVALDGEGKVRYTPPSGFEGDDSFTYTVRDSNGREQQATAIVHVAEPPVTIGGRQRFQSEAELAQYLLENAIRRWGYAFEQSFVRQIYHGDAAAGQQGPSDGHNVFVRGDMVTLAGVFGRDHSDTNTQVAGIDEADVVDTDGDFVYAIVGEELVIVDMADLDAPRLASAIKLDFGASEMYLIGDRLVLVDRGGYGSNGTLLVVDVANRAQPTVRSRVEVDGRIVDTRAIGDDVTFVVDATIGVPLVEQHRIGELSREGNVTTELWRNESLAEFTARERTRIVADTMPEMKIYDGDGDLVETRQLVAAELVYKPISGLPMRLTAVGVLSIGDDALPTPSVASVGLIGWQLEQIYMSTSGVYVLETPEYVERTDGTRSQDTRILFFAGNGDDGLRLVSAGSVRGVALNQFALDEYAGRLRVATTERLLDSAYSWRPLRTENHLFVLEHQGEHLRLVGSVEHLSPTQTIRSVRYLGDMAYVSTYRDVDPLLSVDLSNPTEPRLRGALVVPGFANYLHPVGDDFLIAFGRDDRPPTGEIGSPQVSLFYVGDPDHPQLADRLTMRGATGTASEAFGDHHAVAYFADYGVLSLPIDWQSGQQRRSAAWVFDVDVDPAAGEGSLTYSGKVDHDFAVRRSLRIEDALVTISGGELKTHSIDDVGELRGSLFFGEPLAADWFLRLEDSGTTTLDVLANDHVGPQTQIAEVVYDGDDAEFAIAADGRTLTFTPAADFFGYVVARYAVDVPGRGRRETTVSVFVQGVEDAPRPADDAFDVVAGQTDVALDVLANDVDPDRGEIIFRPIYDGPMVFRIGATDAVGDAIGNGVATAGLLHAPPVSANLGDALTILPPRFYGPLKVVHVSAASHGGTVTIAEGGAKVLYTPADGFTGAETFTYRVEAPNGLTAEATVTVNVALPANDLHANEPAGNRARRLAAIERRARNAAFDAGNTPRPIVQGTRATSTGERRITRNAAAAVHDAALRAATTERRVARRQAAVGEPQQPAVAPPVVAARR